MRDYCIGSPAQHFGFWDLRRHIHGGRSRLSALPVVGDAAFCYHAGRSRRVDLSGRFTHGKDGSILLLPGYARHGSVEELWVEVAHTNGNEAAPFILAADCNHANAAVRQMHQTQALCAVVHDPKVLVTCRQGNGTRIDLLVASICASPYIYSLRYSSCPTSGPHDAMLFNICRDPRAATRTKQVHRHQVLWDKAGGRSLFPSDLAGRFEPS